MVLKRSEIFQITPTNDFSKNVGGCKFIETARIPFVTLIMLFLRILLVCCYVDVAPIGSTPPCNIVLL